MRDQKFKFSAVVFLALLCIVPIASAEDASTETGYQFTVFVTANRFEERLDNLPPNAEVIYRENIEMLPAST